MIPSNFVQRRASPNKELPSTSGILKWQHRSYNSAYTNMYIYIYIYSVEQSHSVHSVPFHSMFRPVQVSIWGAMIQKGLLHYKRKAPHSFNRYNTLHQPAKSSYHSVTNGYTHCIQPQKCSRSDNAISLFHPFTYNQNGCPMLPAFWKQRNVNIIIVTSSELVMVSIYVQNQSIATDCRKFRMQRLLSIAYKTNQPLHPSMHSLVDMPRMRAHTHTHTHTHTPVHRGSCQLPMAVNGCKISVCQFQVGRRSTINTCKMQEVVNILENYTFLVISWF